MEALLEKEADVESWNDERMDELSRRVDEGFKEMREGFSRMDTRIDQMDGRLTSRIDRLFYIQIAFMTSLALAFMVDKI